MLPPFEFSVGALKDSTSTVKENMIFDNISYQQIWAKLCTRSRWALMRDRKNLKNLKEYRPRSDLCMNLSYELVRPPEEIYIDLLRMHEEIRDKLS